MKPTAKKLILGLLLAAEGHPLSVREAILACRLFNITENNVRVTLVRLSAERLIESRGRGAYGLGPAAQTTASEVAHWHHAEQRLRSWSGEYICVHSGALGRSDRAALRQRERALEMLGLRELDRGLHVRPDNLSGGVDALRLRLYSLGLEPGAAVFIASGFDAARVSRIAQLWDSEALNQRYRERGRQLEAWLELHTDLEPDVAARESYLLGQEAIRTVVFDPWLPEPLVDAAARHAYVEMVRRFDSAGKAIWRSLGVVKGAMPTMAAVPSLPTHTLQ